MRLSFGRFTCDWPDRFTFPDAKAFCLDCSPEKDGLTGNISIVPAVVDKFILQAEGPLLNKCGDHHFEMKKVGGDKAPNQHSVFRVEVSSRVLGQTKRVSSAAAEVFFDLTDNNLREEMVGPWQKIANDFKLFWGYY